jgi:hypothetical protein
MPLVRKRYSYRLTVCFYTEKDEHHIQYNKKDKTEELTILIAVLNEYVHD